MQPHAGVVETRGVMAEFNLEDREYIELNDLLKVMGLCDSGGAAKTAISEGLVTVDGQVELRRRCKIRTGQIVEYEGTSILLKGDRET